MLSPDRYFTPHELVRYFGGRISYRSLEEWRRRGTGPKFQKLGRKVLYPSAEVIAWEKANTFSSGAEAKRNA